MIVDRCPKLEDLHIQAKSSSTGDVYPMLQRGRWTSLKRLTLTIQVTLEVSAIIEHFFINHPTLERLYFCNTRLEQAAYPFPLNDLPNLRSLHMAMGAFFIVSFELAERLDDVGLSLSHTAHEPFALVPHSPNLRSFSYATGSYVHELDRLWMMLTRFPKLERLAINAYFSPIVSTSLQCPGMKAKSYT